MLNNEKELILFKYSVLNIERENNTTKEGLTKTLNALKKIQKEKFALKNFASPQNMFFFNMEKNKQFSNFGKIRFLHSRIKTNQKLLRELY